MSTCDSEIVGHLPRVIHLVNGSAEPGLPIPVVQQHVLVSFKGMKMVRMTVAAPAMQQGLPRWFSGKESPCQGRRCRRRWFDPWVGNIPWQRAWRPTPVFLLENPIDRGAWRATVHGVTESDTDEATEHAHTLYVTGIV